MAAVRLPNSAHEARPWVMGQIAPDFTLLDVWALPVEGGREEFDRFLELMSSFDPAGAESPPARLLFRIRSLLGKVTGWDEAQDLPIPGCTETTLAARLPAALQGSARDDRFGDRLEPTSAGFVPLYRTADEWAAEISNQTVHGVLQLTWVEQADGRFRGQLGVYVKPRGVLGTAYLRFIGPFRHLIVYPALTKQIGRAWASR